MRRSPAVSRFGTGTRRRRQIAKDNLRAIRQDMQAGGPQGGGVNMRQRYLLVSLAVALFTSTAFGAAPAAATPCTNLSGLPLQHATITSATDNDTGVFVTPRPRRRRSPACRPSAGSRRR